MKRIIYIEDSEIQRMLFTQMLKRKYDVTVPKSATEAKELLLQDYDHYVIDYMLNRWGESGEYYIKWIKDNKSNPIITILTAYIGLNPIPSTQIITQPCDYTALAF